MFDELQNDLLLSTSAVAISTAADLPPDDWQAEFLQSPAQQIILNNCRQSGKTTLTAVQAYAQSLLPKSLTLICSPGLRQSTEVLLKINDIEDSLGNPLVKLEDSKLSCVYENGSRIICLPATHTIRGYSAPDLIVIDEAAWVPDVIYGSLRPMQATNADTARIIIMSTPHGKLGFFHDTFVKGKSYDPVTGDGWHKFMVTADDCPRITEEYLARERADTSELMFRQEYYCEFVETEEQVFGTDFIEAAFDTDVETLGYDMTSDLAPLE